METVAQRESYRLLYAALALNVLVVSLIPIMCQLTSNELPAAVAVGWPVMTVSFTAASMIVIGGVGTDRRVVVRRRFYGLVYPGVFGAFVASFTVDLLHQSMVVTADTALMGWAVANLVYCVVHRQDLRPLAYPRRLGLVGLGAAAVLGALTGGVRGPAAALAQAGIGVLYLATTLPLPDALVPGRAVTRRPDTP